MYLIVFRSHALNRLRMLRTNANHLPFYAFDQRRRFYGQQIEDGKFAGGSGKPTGKIISSRYCDDCVADS
jgi:hypothetical protein